MRILSRCATLALMFVVLASVVAMAGQPGQKGGKGKGGPMRGILKELNLTEAQQQQIQPLNRQLGDRMKAFQQAFDERLKGILTPAQLSKAEQLKGQGERNSQNVNPNEILRQLDLTPQQKQQVRAVREEQAPQIQAAVQSFVSQVKPILTPEQQTRFEQLVKERGPGSGGGQRPGGGSQ